MKKYLLIGLIVILGIGLFVVGYFLRQPKTPPVLGGGNHTPPVSTSTPTVTPAKNSKLKLESLGFKVLSYFTQKDGNLILIQPNGYIISLNGGTNTLINETSVDNIIETAFSFDGKKILFGFGGWNNPQFSVFDVEKKSWQPLVAGVTEAVWNPSDLRLAYVLKKGGYASLSVLDFGVSKPKAKEVLRVHAEDLRLGWLGKDEILFYNKGNSQVESSAWKFSISKLKLTPLFQDKTSFGMVGDPVGEDILASFDNGAVFSLSVFGKQGEFLKELAVKTLPEKCAFNIETEILTATSTKAKGATIEKKYLFCATPKNFGSPTGQLLFENYKKKDAFSIDNFFRFEVPSGRFSSVYDGVENLDAISPRVSNNKLYFINRYDDKLYSISLEKK